MVLMLLRRCRYGTARVSVRDNRRPWRTGHHFLHYAWAAGLSLSEEAVRRSVSRVLGGRYQPNQQRRQYENRRFLESHRRKPRDSQCTYLKVHFHRRVRCEDTDWNGYRYCPLAISTRSVRDVQDVLRTLQPLDKNKSICEYTLHWGER